jgi:hypothetical protein
MSVALQAFERSERRYNRHRHNLPAPDAARDEWISLFLKGARKAIVDVRDDPGFDPYSLGWSLEYVARFMKATK